jgi:hypothetical protein
MVQKDRFEAVQKVRLKRGIFYPGQRRVPKVEQLLHPRGLPWERHSPEWRRAAIDIPGKVAPEGKKSRASMTPSARQGAQVTAAECWKEF